MAHLQASQTEPDPPLEIPVPVDPAQTPSEPESPQPHDPMPAPASPEVPEPSDAPGSEDQGLTTDGGLSFGAR